MKNYNRYKNIDPDKYEEISERGLSYLIMRKPADKVLLPIMDKIKNKKICDVGCGSGYYSKRLINNGNNLVGIDINPHLNKLKMKVYKGNANNFSNLIIKKKDCVFSAWMTEYLNRKDLDSFFNESAKVIKKNGKLFTTVIRNKGVGWLYIFMARHISKVSKYNYSKQAIQSSLLNSGYEKIKFHNLNSWWSIPFAYLVEATIK